ncbi:hypothetical protein [Saliphagus infecundisoli]|uniref:DUF4239 domain-containing protein n=1 Tax=Saliphagus infecundisoli TaxID=1849069 RepID=A0ABD5QKV5_9EURY|nr:hypothetical protein [Saliphagus infecundisoli]
MTDSSDDTDDLDDTGDGDEPTDSPSETALPAAGPPPERTESGDPGEEAGGADDDADDPTDSTSTDSTATDSSLGLSFVIYVLRLTYAFLVIGAGVLAAGARIAFHHLGDADRRGRSRRWLFLEGDRGVIVAGFVGGVFAVAILLGVSDVIGVRESRFVTTMFSTMIAGLFSFIPIVVSVNQLIVSRLFGTPDRLSERIDDVREFRRRVESRTPGSGVSPTEPGPFFARLAGTLGNRADTLAARCDRTDDDDRSPALEAVSAYAVRTGDHAELLCDRLNEGPESVFDVVLPALDRDYASDANEARRLARRFDEELSTRTRTLLSELGELNVVVDATRQYFMAIYLQQELARLSRRITYSGTAALLTSTLVIMIYASGYPPVAHEGPLLVLVSLALAMAFSPLAILFAYVIRIATVLKRTSAPGAFTPPGESRR